MRFAFAIVAFFALSAPVFSQDMEFGFGPGGFRMEPGYGWHHHDRGHHYRDRGMCRELRAACMHKEELGEEGMGNCRRYRSMCR